MNRFCFFILFALCCLLVSCEKDNIGAALQPEEDKIVVLTDSFVVQSTTELLPSRHSEVAKLELGCVHDPVYGQFKLDFLTEFKYSRDTFPASATNATLSLVMYYKSYYGDSLSVNEATVYALQNPLIFEENYTSDIQVADFCNQEEVLGKKAYVPYDNTVSDSLRATPSYCDKVEIPFPQSYCQELLTNKHYTQSQAAFLDFIKGVYVTTYYGNNAVLNVDSVNLELAYQYAPDVAKPDSLVRAVRIYPANKEVTNVLRVSEVTPPVQVLNQVDSIHSVVSSSGYGVRVKLPWDEILSRLSENATKGERFQINHASLMVEQACMENADESAMTPPQALLLIREKDMEAFFTQSKYPASGIQTAVGFWQSEGYYLFNNMAAYLEDILSEQGTDFAKENDFFVLPVSGITEVSGTAAVVRHLFKPYAVSVRSGSNKTSPMRLAITYTNL